MYYKQLTKITKLMFTVLPHFYLRTSRVWTACPSGTRKRNERSESIRSIGFGKDLEFAARWLWKACCVLKPKDTLYLSAPHHALQPQFRPTESRIPHHGGSAVSEERLYFTDACVTGSVTRGRFPRNLAPIPSFLAADISLP